MLNSLRHASPLILPSMLQCNFGNLQEEVEKLQDASVEALHLDVMDGHFVPNFTYGMTIVKAFRDLTSMPLDVHLMISDPAKYAMQFAEAGADLLTFHIETMDDPSTLLQSVRASGTAVGLAINPSTSIDKLLPFLPLCDLVLVMSVEAGFGGQSFNAAMLDRVRQLRALAGDELLIEMDGGLNEQTIRDCYDAGANLMVVGSAIFGKPDYCHAITSLRKKLPAVS